MRRALTVANVLAIKIKTIKFHGRFYDAFGNPQNKGRWLIWGESSSGKSSFLMQLSKEFATTEKVLYNTLEESDDDENLQDRLRLFQMQDVSNNFLIISESLEDLSIRLRRRNSAGIVVIDSAPYFFLGYTFNDYLSFTREFKNKIIIFTGHASGRSPKSELEIRIMYDATQKIWVDGYLATNKGRKFGPYAKQYLVWEKGYNDLNGKI